MSARRNLLPVLFWSVITAAFIGPGTVATCAAAGARYSHALLWALSFSTIACLVLQEASARLAIVSGLDLGAAIRSRFHAGTGGLLVLLMVLGGIVLGCAAYQAGNILGAVSGVGLGIDLPAPVCTVVIGLAAATLLWFGSAGTVARIMGGVVAFMGAAFLMVAIRIAPAPAEILTGAIVPSWPTGSGWLILGLVGTTVVPYNLFLGSALARGQVLREVRLGLGLAVPLGGLISMAILVVGASVAGQFSFEALAELLTGRLGAWAGPLFAFGLFAAGFTSSITAPMAAALTARSLFAADRVAGWGERSWRYRAVWGIVLLTGIAFGLSGVKPIPAILIAQALNGVLLPFAGLVLLMMLNDRQLMGAAGMNRGAANLALGTVVGLTLLLGLSRAVGPLIAVLGISRPDPLFVLGLTLLLAAGCAVPVVRSIRRRRAAIPGVR